MNIHESRISHNAPNSSPLLHNTPTMNAFFFFFVFRAVTFYKKVIAQLEGGDKEGSRANPRSRPSCPVLSTYQRFLPTAVPLLSTPARPGWPAPTADSLESPADSRRSPGRWFRKGSRSSTPKRPPFAPSYGIWM